MRNFLVTTALKHRIKHIHVPAPPPTRTTVNSATVNSAAIVQQNDNYYDTPSLDAHVEDEPPAGVKITTKHKRYANSVRTSLSSMSQQ